MDMAMSVEMMKRTACPATGVPCARKAKLRFRKKASVAPIATPTAAPTGVGSLRTRTQVRSTQMSTTVASAPTWRLRAAQERHQPLDERPERRAAVRSASGTCRAALSLLGLLARDTPGGRRCPASGGHRRGRPPPPPTCHRPRRAAPRADEPPGRAARGGRRSRDDGAEEKLREGPDGAAK